MTSILLKILLENGYFWRRQTFVMNTRFRNVMGGNPSRYCGSTYPAAGSRWINGL